MRKVNCFTKLAVSILMLLSVMFFIGCGSDDEDKGGNDGSASKITATNVINGSAQITNVKALAYWENGYDYGNDVIAQVPYQNNGFKLELPTTLSAKYLMTMNDLEVDVPGISISDKNAKIFAISEIEGYDKDEYYIGDFYLEEIDGYDQYYTSWAYSDRNVDIKGEYKEIDDYYDEEYVSKADLTLKKGWNVVYGSYTESYNSSTGRDVYKATVTSKKPSGVNYSWNFYDYGYYSSTDLRTKSAENNNSVFSKLKDSRKKGTRESK